MADMKKIAALALVLPFAMGTAFAASPESGAATGSTAADKTAPATIDSNSDGKADAWDRDGNGTADAWDTNGDGKPDKFDDDGDGKPDKPAR